MALHHHQLGGNNETDARKHFYCGKCRIDFKDEAELKGHFMESSEHVVCPECSQEFPNVGALEIHSKQVCFQLFSPTLDDATSLNTSIRSTNPNQPLLMSVLLAMFCSALFPQSPSTLNPDSARATSQPLTFAN